jgi:hypothetical protein
MRLRLFQNRALRVLGETGEVSTAPIMGGGRTRFLIARGLCRFHWFAPAQTMTHATRMTAARTYAEANAPFADFDFALAPAENGVGVWWWDRARVAGLMPAGTAYENTRIAPESVAHAPADGWRQAQVSDGFEMQCWRGGALVVSAWRRQAWTHAQWRALVLGAGIDAPEAMPSATAVAMDAARLRTMRGRRGEIALWETVERMGLSLGVFLLLAAAFFAGQGIRYGQLEAAAAQQEAQRGIAVTTDPARAAVARDVALVRSYRAIDQEAEALAGALFARDLASRHDVRVLRWTISNRVVVVQAEPANTRGSLAAFVDLLIESDRFASVAPRFSQLGDGVEVRLSICPAVLASAP